MMRVVLYLAYSVKLWRTCETVCWEGGNGQGQGADIQDLRLKSGRVAQIAGRPTPFSLGYRQMRKMGAVDPRQVQGQI